MVRKTKLQQKESQEKNIKKNLEISKENFSQIFTFIDFANVNHWYDDDPYNLEGKSLLKNEQIEIDLKKLKSFLDVFSDDIRFYYGHDSENKGSLSFITVARSIFGKSRVFTKRVQKIKHKLKKEDSIKNTRIVHSDDEGDFVFLPKCNFDVEMAVDAIRLADKYDTICLLSSDADFAALLRYLRRINKKNILIKGGRIDSSLGKLIDLKINASEIKSDIVRIKQEPDNKVRFRG
jgi:uncharacterized LabA/DUF88 family protein